MVDSTDRLPRLIHAIEFADGKRAGIELAARLIEKQAADYADEFGHDDMGELSFGTGQHAEVKRDHYSTLIDAAEAVRGLTHDASKCDQAVFKDGASLGLFDIPKELAESFCVSASRMTGHHYDWHYIGGRVHIKVIESGSEQ